MNQNLFSNNTVGIDFEGMEVKAAFLSKTKSGPKVEKLASIPLSSDEEGNVKPLYIDNESLEKITEKWLLVSGLATSDVLIRPLELNLAKRKDIESILGFQVEPILPYPVEEAILDFSIISQDSKGAKVVFQSVLKNSLKEHLNRFEMVGAEPEIVTSTPAALAAFGYFFSTTPRSTWPQFILLFGNKRTVCVLAQEGKVLAAHSFSISIESLTQSAAKDHQNPKRKLLPIYLKCLLKCVWKLEKLF